MPDEEKQRVTLSLTRGTMDILRDEAKRKGFTVVRGPEAGEGNVSRYIDSIAWDIQNRRSKMELEQVSIGLFRVYELGAAGQREDQTFARAVEFRAEQLAMEDCDDDDPDVPFEYSHSVERLYRTDDGRYIVYRMDFATTEPEEPLVAWGSLTEIDEEALHLGGKYRSLGRAAGIDKTLTLDEALAQQDEILAISRKRSEEQ